MTKVKLIKRNEIKQKDNGHQNNLNKTEIEPLTREVVKKWVSERQAKAFHDPRNAFFSLFNTLQST